ncbi:hypothetical protein B0I37DRAFT_383252 [Chaetomium sp. MPI-CAGE-AT-0009]|nr:hypothetical protein B0I37DRAFT_383252 [Chaetomium sp. MPI-CAGE-AT-0009]
MPLTFIYGMHRSLLEKILLCGLMCAGLGATAAALVFLITLVNCFAVCTEAVWNFRLDICTTTQLFIGVIAANLPCLKAPVHRLLVRWGIIRPANHPAAGVSPESFLGRMTHGSHFAQQLHDLATLRDADSEKASHTVNSASLGESRLLAYQDRLETLQTSRSVPRHHPEPADSPPTTS